MKRIIISLALTAIVLGASIFEVIYVGKKSDDYTDRIKKIDAMLSNNDTESALKECRSLESDWDGDAEKIYTLLSHDTVDSVGYGISGMRAYIENDNTDMYYFESAGAKKGLASIKGSEYPLLENIL